MGFDVSPMAAFVPEAFPLQATDTSLAVLSDGNDAFRFDFTARVQPAADEAIINLTANRDGEVNGIVQWIRLELDEETALETPPEAESVSFTNLLFYPLLRKVRVRSCDVVSVHVGHDGRRLTIWA